MSIMGKSINLLLWALLSFFLILCSCQNDMTEVQNVDPISVSPDLLGENAVIYYSDSAVLKMRMEAPEVEQYLQIEEPVIVFPNGIKVVFYDEFGEEASEITARWSTYYQSKSLWEVKGDVNFRTKEGVRIQTEQAFWEEKKALIYSDKFTRYTDSDGTIYIGEHGFEAAQDMSRWELFQTRRSSIIVRE